MPKIIAPPSPAFLARIAGFAYLAIFALAIAANGFVLEGLVDQADPAGTVRRVAAAAASVRAATGGLLAVLIFDIVAGWALYLLLRPFAPELSLLALLFRLAYTVSHVAAVLYLVHALRLATAAAPAGGGPEAAVIVDALAHLLVGAHGPAFTVTLIFFGVHLLLLGFLLWRTRLIPPVFGLLVALAGGGYVIDGFAYVVFAAWAELPAAVPAAVVIVPALVGEGALCLWLIFRGVHTD
jgi:hypothetical protein